MKNLRTIRERKGLTQTELGKLSDTDAAAISHYEAGLRSPSWTTANCSLDELAGRAEPSDTTLERNRMAAQLKAIAEILEKGNK